MASEEHLRREILKLSSLIAQNSPAQSVPRPQGPSTFKWRNPNPSTVPVLPAPRPNPFEQFRTNEYLNECFPDASTFTSKNNSVYVNPAYLAKTGIRPHINLSHVAFKTLNTKPEESTIPVVSDPGIRHPSPIPALAAQHQILPPLPVQQPPQNAVPTMKTKYKLDRRLKRSPSRKPTFKARSPIAKTKLVKRYSMRVIPSTKWQTVKKSTQFTYKPAASFFKHRLLIRPKVTKGKSLVHINGANFISKNGGKTLRRLSSKGTVVSINGNHFVAKNRGKTIKRVSESSVPKHLVRLSQNTVQTPGVRLANRAIQKSKLTLTQRVWKKKQFCMFYNRFGECKRKDEGSCPYKHDRNQLMICPKFIVGKCTVQDCKLSHDLKLGRMPPCQFFNKSNCSRENCPYPHIKSSPVKKSSKTESDQTPGKPEKQPRKRLSSLRKDSTKKKRPNKARYYQQAPDSQPIVSIVPRRIRPSKPAEEPVAGPSVKIEVDTSVSSSNSSLSAPKPEPLSLSERRLRLMSRVQQMRAWHGKKESTAPQYLPLQ